MKNSLTVKIEDYKGSDIEKNFETPQLDAEVKDGKKDSQRQHAENNEYLKKTKNGNK